MDSNRRLSLARSTSHGLLVMLLALGLTAGAGLWAIQKDAHRKDEVVMELFAKTNAQIVAQQLKHYRERMHALAQLPRVSTLLQLQDDAAAEQWIEHARKSLPGSVKLTLITVSACITLRRSSITPRGI